MSSSEREIRELYSKLREEDASSAPSFDQLTAGAERPRFFPMLRPVTAVAAISFLAVAGGLLLRQQTSLPADMAASGGIEWRSPTDFLLEFGSNPVLKGRPILDFPAPPALKPPGEEEKKP